MAGRSLFLGYRYVMAALEGLAVGWVLGFFCFALRAPGRGSAVLVLVLVLVLVRVLVRVGRGGGGGEGMTNKRHTLQPTTNG